MIFNDSFLENIQEDPTTSIITVSTYPKITPI